MTNPSERADLARYRRERIVRTHRHADHCVMLAVVTSTDVAAALIDQAIELRRGLPRAAA